MYRDSATTLDEHDRAVGAILIGEALVAQCERAVARTSDRTTLGHDKWRAMREVHDDYPEIWRQLDRARSVLAVRGGNTTAYDEMRPHVRPSLAVPSESAEIGSTIDPDALDDARRAIGELKLAVPGADWKAIAKRTTALVDTPQLHRRHKMPVFATLTVLGLAMVTWFAAITPDKKVDKAEVMRRELAEVTTQRKLRIDVLAPSAATRCDAPLAHEYVKLLVMDGRGDDANAFADGYTVRCGEDTVVDNWANAPAPRPRR